MTQDTSEKLSSDKINRPKASEKITYTISDLSREFEITTRTIRFYESRGLIQPERIGTSRLHKTRLAYFAASCSNPHSAAVWIPRNRHGHAT